MVVYCAVWRFGGTTRARLRCRTHRRLGLRLRLAPGQFHIPLVQRGDLRRAGPRCGRCSSPRRPRWRAASRACAWARSDAAACSRVTVSRAMSRSTCTASGASTTRTRSTWSRPPALGQQRNHQDLVGPAVPRPPRLAFHLGADRRVQDRLEPARGPLASAKMISRRRRRSSRPSASSTLGAEGRRRRRRAPAGRARRPRARSRRCRSPARRVRRTGWRRWSCRSRCRRSGRRGRDGLRRGLARARPAAGSAAQPGQRQVAAHDLRAPHQRDPAGRGEVRPERDRHVAVTAAEQDQRDADDRAGEAPRAAGSAAASASPSRPRARRAA